jgi:predicted SAM-dependent methyltransferase
VKLHLGCGKRDFGPGWYNVDGNAYPHVHHRDLTRLPLADDSAELAYSSHVIEYFDRDEVESLLKEWRRVLKPGAPLYLAVPDFAPMAKLYSEGMFPLRNFLGPLYGKIRLGDAWVYHKTVYDYSDLSAMLASLGFRDIARYDWRATEHAAFDDHSQAYLPHMDKEHGTLISLNVSCRK